MADFTFNFLCATDITAVFIVIMRKVQVTVGLYSSLFSRLQWDDASILIFNILTFLYALQNDLPGGLNKKRLLALLKAFGEYPAKYRYDQENSFWDALLCYHSFWKRDTNVSCSQNKGSPI